MAEQVCVITGGSRGIGAETAVMLARRGSDIAFNFLTKEARARSVVERIEALGRKAEAIQCDLTDGDQVAMFARRIRSDFGMLTGLVLNAAGGLEKNRADDYAYRLNVTANHRLIDELMPVMSRGSAIVFVTSHMSHFYGELPVVMGYERVASTKKKAETTLRERIPELSRAGVRLVVVSGDLIDGTINAKLMQREYSNLIAKRELEVGPLPSVEEFGAAIVDAVTTPTMDSGTTVFVGSTAWDTYHALHEQERSRQIR